MSPVIRCLLLILTLAFTMGGCALQDVGRLLGGGEGALPLVPIGGIPISMVAEVETDHRETAGGGEVLSWSLAWRHSAEGHLSTTLGWAPAEETFDRGHGYGRDHCFSPCGAEHNLTFNWESELPFDDPLEAPEFHIRIYGDEALVLYGAADVAYERPPMPECPCLPDWRIPEGRHAISYETYHYADAERAPDAADSMLDIVQSGVVLLRIPIEELRAGTEITTAVDLNEQEGDADGFAWEDRLRITLTLTSS